MVRVSLTLYDRAAQSRNKISAAAASAITTIAFIPMPPCSLFLPHCHLCNVAWLAQ